MYQHGAFAAWHGIGGNIMRVRYNGPAADVYGSDNDSLSDGLYNMGASALPHCQVDHIFECVQLAKASLRLTGRVLTWVDGLCLPSQLLTVDGLVRASGTFNAVKDVVSQATVTVILDSDIATIPINCSYEEAFIKITYSSWNSRFWTLHEAIVARRLFFKAADGLLSLSDLENKFTSYRQQQRGHLPTLPYLELRKLARQAVSDAAVERYNKLLDDVLADRQVGSAEDRLYVEQSLRTAPGRCLDQMPADANSIPNPHSGFCESTHVAERSGLRPTYQIERSNGALEDCRKAEDRDV